MAKKHSTPAGSQVVHRPAQTPKGLTTQTEGWEAVWLQQNYKPTRMPYGPVVDVDGKAVRWSSVTGEVTELKPGDIVAQGDVVLTSPDGFVMIQGALSTETGAIATPNERAAPEVLGDGGYTPTLVGRDPSLITSPTLSHAMGLNLPLGLGTGVLPSAINHAPVYDAAANPLNVNFNPNTGNYQLSTTEDTPIGSRVQASDPDGDAVGYVQGSNPANGSVVVNPDGTWVYTPNANYNGPDSFTVIASDGRGGQATSVVSINVLPVNDPPQTLDITATGNEDPPTPIEVALAATDVDSAIASYRVITLPTAAQGVLYRDVGMTQPIAAGDLVPAGSVYFMPSLNWNGTTNFQYAAIDVPPAGQPALEDPTPATATVVVNPVNDQPVIVVPTVPNNNGQVTTPEDTPYSFSGAGNTVSVTDPDNATLTASLTVENGTLVAGTNPNITVTGNGTAASPLVLSGPVPDINAALASLTYTPKPDWNGTDQLTITTTDPLGASATGTKPITVTPVADSRPDISITSEDIPLVNVNLIQNDGFTTTPLSKVVIWTLQDNSPTHSASHFIDYGSITLDPVTQTVQTYTGGIPVYDSADRYAGQIISVSRVSQGLNEVLTFIPAPNYNNADPNGNPLLDQVTGQPITLVVNYQVAPDYGTGVMTAGAETSTWSIVVKMINDPPVYQQTALSPNFSATPAAAGVTYEYNQQVMEDSNPAAFASNTGQVHAVDVEDGSLTSGYRLLLNGALTTAGATTHGTVTVNDDGTWQYTPDANFNGLDSFQVQVSDKNGSAVTTTVKLGVTAVNDVPVFNVLNYAAATPEDTQATGVVQASDVDITLGDKSQWLVYSLGSTAGMNPGSVVGVTQDGHWTYQPAPNFNGSESFQIIVNDNSGATNATAITTVTVNVSPVNDPPIFITTPADPLAPGFNPGTLNYNYSVPGNTPVITDKVSASDVDGNPVTFSLVMAPNITGALTQPVVVVNPDGTWSYTPAVMPAGNPTSFYVGGDSFAIRASDGQGGTTTTTIQLDLTNPSAIPVVNSVTAASVTNPVGHVSALSLNDVLGGQAGSSMDQLLGHLGGPVQTSGSPTVLSTAAAAPTTTVDTLSALSLVGPSDPLTTALNTLAQSQQALNNHHGGGA